ncbi:APC family permease [Nonomuraea sp. NPDC005650]|uniref:APC family permease n=1 Tax=Nonomuraea sp. NPDC005650 TaxID=3157045 RepID=UPI0033B0C629
MKLRRDVRLVGLLFTSVGAIIGSGWLFGAQSAANTAGPASILSWIIGGFMIMTIALVYAELGTMLPLSGGVTRFPHYAFGSFASYGFGWILWITCGSAAAIEVEAAIQYSSVHFTFLMHEVDGVAVLTFPTGFAVAVVLMALLTVVNLYGVKWFARANNLLVWWKIAVIVAVIVAFAFTAFHSANFTLPAAGGFAPFGIEGILSAIATSGVVFSYLGFRQGIELAGETDNPRRNVPIAVIGSVLLTGALYILLQIVFIGALSPDSLAGGWGDIALASGSATGIFGPLAALATILGLNWLAVVLYVDAVVSPADSGLIYTVSTSRVMYAMGRNKNAPSGLARLDKRGTPYISLILTFLVGVVFFLPFPGWQSLVGFVTAATVLSLGSGALALAALRRSLPEHPRPFKLPGMDVIPFLAFFSSNLIIFWTGWETYWKLCVAVLLGYVVFFATQPFIKDGPAMELRASSWFLPWLGGLALISFMEESLGFAWGSVAIGVWSLVIYGWAVRTRLSDVKVSELLDSGFVGEEETMQPVPAATTQH